MNRPDKRSYYLDIAKIVAARSTCLRKRWGAVIVKDDVIVATGYNGAPRGCANCIDKGVCWRAEHGIPRGTRYELCLTGDTTIALSSRTLQSIYDLVDSCVMLHGYDTTSREFRDVPAGNIRQTGETDVLMHVTVLNAFKIGYPRTIRCTPDHEFLTIGQDGSLRYIKAEDLDPSIKLLGGVILTNGTYAEVHPTILKVERETLDKPIPVYDMEVPDVHNFPVYIDNRTVVMVHNCAANGTHAEQNAIMAAGRDRCIGATMYVYGHDVESGDMVHNPDSCQMCKRAIINSGIEEVVYAVEKRDEKGINVYDTRRIKVDTWIHDGAVEPNPEGY